MLCVGGPLGAAAQVPRGSRGRAQAHAHTQTHAHAQTPKHARKHAPWDSTAARSGRPLAFFSYAAFAEQAAQGINRQRSTKRR